MSDLIDLKHVNWNQALVTIFGGGTVAAVVGTFIKSAFGYKGDRKTANELIEKDVVQWMIDTKKSLDLNAEARIIEIKNNLEKEYEQDKKLCHDRIMDLTTKQDESKEEIRQLRHDVNTLEEVRSQLLLQNQTLREQNYELRYQNNGLKMELIKLGIVNIPDDKKSIEDAPHS